MTKLLVIQTKHTVNMWDTFQQKLDHELLDQLNESRGLKSEYHSRAVMIGKMNLICPLRNVDAILYD